MPLWFIKIFLDISFRTYLSEGHIFQDIPSGILSEHKKKEASN
jgi:hypothetical protein